MWFCRVFVPEPVAVGPTALLALGRACGAAGQPGSPACRQVSEFFPCFCCLPMLLAILQQFTCDNLPLTGGCLSLQCHKTCSCSVHQVQVISTFASNIFGNHAVALQEAEQVSNRADGGVRTSRQHR